MKLKLEIKQSIKISEAPIIVMALENLYTRFFSHTSLDKTKIKKAIQMFKNSSHTMYIEKLENGISGIVKSQSGKDLEYASFLWNSGDFCCGTQNVHRCGGLRGGICKHIILVLIAAVKNGDISEDEAILWLEKSLSKSCNFGAHHLELQALFIKYQTMLNSNGEVDWKPVELSSEDYIGF